MNLEQARTKKFDDILYMAIEYFKKQPNMPSELCKTDEWFFQRTFEIFTDIENNNPVGFYQTRDTGMTTALQFIVSYYTLHFKNITILTNPGSYFTRFEVVYNMFTQILNLPVQAKFTSNKMLFKIENYEFCDISIRDVATFNNADLLGPVILDTKKPMKNYSKYNDMLKNKQKYDRLVFNFPENEDMLKLAKEYNIETKTIKIF